MAYRVPIATRRIRTLNPSSKRSCYLQGKAIIASVPAPCKVFLNLAAGRSSHVSAPIRSTIYYSPLTIHSCGRMYNKPYTRCAGGEKVTRKLKIPRRKLPRNCLCDNGLWNARRILRGRVCMAHRLIWPSSRNTGKVGWTLAHAVLVISPCNEIGMVSPDYAPPITPPDYAATTG